jgi:hypothetical protein
VIDGLRTRVRESSRFKAGNRGGQKPRACVVPRAKASASRLEAVQSPQAPSAH